jgi:hypothetical protein
MHSVLTMQFLCSFRQGAPYTQCPLFNVSFSGSELVPVTANSAAFYVDLEGLKAMTNNCVQEQPVSNILHFSRQLMLSARDICSGTPTLYL